MPFVRGDRRTAVDKHNSITCATLWDTCMVQWLAPKGDNVSCPEPRSGVQVQVWLLVKGKLHSIPQMWVAARVLTGVESD